MYVVIWVIHRLYPFLQRQYLWTLAAYDTKCDLCYDEKAIAFGEMQKDLST